MHKHIFTTGDWQIDYVTGGPFEVKMTDKVDVKVYSMLDGSICKTPHLIGKNMCIIAFNCNNITCKNMVDGTAKAVRKTNFKC